MDRTRLDELIARLEAATRRDMNLGREVYRACGWRQTGAGYFLGPITHWSSPDRKVSFDDDDFHRHDPTASIDAALTLIPEGWSWLVGDDKGGPLPCKYASLHPAQQRYDVSCETTCEAATPALALCIASLKARARNP